jgi:coenzyme F420 hydrogenase subunit beta
MDKKMNNSLSINIIEKNDLCISCGACIHICPFDNIFMKYKEDKGKYDAVVKKEDICLKCNGKKNCLAVCPSYNTNYKELADSEKNNFLGKVENVYNGYSLNKKLRINASSGGIIREISRQLLENNEIDGIITITHDKGLDYSPKIIKDISEMPNSIYHNINYENAIKLLKNNNGKYLLIGLPCHITSIEKFTNKKKYFYLKERIFLKIALICGYTFERINMEFFAEINNFKMENITYRENGRFRKTRIINKNRTLLFDVYNPNTLMEKINNSIMFDKFLSQRNCLYCVDHIGYCADIVVGDAWQERYNNDNIGTNIIIVRTERGDNLMNRLNSIYLEKGSLSDIEESQHMYAKPFLGLSMAKSNIFKDEFIPIHKFSSNIIDNKDLIDFSLKDKIKIIYLKKLLRKRYFRLVRFIYILLEFKLVTKLVIKKILRRKI